MTTPPRKRARKQVTERCTSFQEGSKESLLPGILDDITLHHIVPKLPWKVFYILSCVSRAWFHGIRTRQVYDARVRSHSTETLAVMISSCGGTAAEPLMTVDLTVDLCSMRDDWPSNPCYAQTHPFRTRLPPITFRYAQCVCSDGYIYLLAARRVGQREDNSLFSSDKVFVFDVAGQRAWRECASMNEPRLDFGYGFMHGKLYVFGGFATTDLSSYMFGGSEVYDPKEDRWTPIRPSTILRYRHKVVSVGDEFFVHGGMFFDRAQHNARKMVVDDQNNVFSAAQRCANFNPTDFLEVYHPIKDEWRIVNPFVENLFYGHFFGASGKFYRIKLSSIDVYAGENSWTHLHSFSFPIHAPADSYDCWVKTAIVVDGELSVKVSWLSDDHENFGDEYFQSKGFGGESEEMMWQDAPQFEIIDIVYKRLGNFQGESSYQLIQL